MKQERKINDPVVRAAADAITTQDGGTHVITTNNQQQSRRARADALPSDLRMVYSQRRFTLEQAEAWATLRTAFGGDRDKAANTVLMAMGAG